MHCRCARDPGRILRSPLQGDHNYTQNTQGSKTWAVCGCAFSTKSKNQICSLASILRQETQTKGEGTFLSRLSWIRKSTLLRVWQRFASFRPKALFIITACAFHSCLPDAQPPPSESEAPPVWNLDSFPKSPYLLIALTKAEAKVSKTQTILGSLDSEIEILANETGQSLLSGKVFAQYKEELIRQAVEKTKRQIAQTEAEIQQQLEIEIPKKLLELEQSIQAAEEAERIQSQLDQDKVAGNPVLNNVFAPKIQQGMAPEQLALLKKQKQHLEKRKDSPPPRSRKPSVNSVRNWNKSKMSSPPRNCPCPSAAPCTSSSPVSRGKAPTPVQNQQPIAQCDHGDSLLFYLDASTPYLADAPTRQLILRHSPVGKEPVLATFSSSKVTWQQPTPTFPNLPSPRPGSLPKPYRHLSEGRSPPKLSQPCHIVPKLSLLASAGTKAT